MIKQYLSNCGASVKVIFSNGFLSFAILIGSLSIVGVSILPYAEIEQYYFMNNCYVCIYK